MRSQASNRGACPGRQKVHACTYTSFVRVWVLKECACMTHGMPAWAARVPVQAAYSMSLVLERMLEVLAFYERAPYTCSRPDTHP